MAHKVRCGLVAAATAVACFVGSSAAMAAVSLNGGPISMTATARNPVLIESSGSPTTVNCLASQIRGTVQSNGTGTIPRGNAAFVNCTLGLSGLTFTHSGDWTISTDFLLDVNGRIIGVAATLTLPSGSAQLSAGGCTFELIGTAVSLQTLTATTPPALVSISTLPFASSTLGLTVGNSRGCGGSGIADGDLARFNAGYTLSSTLTGTLVP